MEKTKASYQWAEAMMTQLSKQGYTGTITIRFVNGGVQGLSVSQELNPQQGVPFTITLHHLNK